MVNKGECSLSADVCVLKCLLLSRGLSVGSKRSGEAWPHFRHTWFIHALIQHVTTVPDGAKRLRWLSMMASEVSAPTLLLLAFRCDHSCLTARIASRSPHSFCLIHPLWLTCGEHCAHRK